MKQAKKMHRSAGAAKEEGARAYLLGRELTSCPYSEKEDKELFDSWTDGWCEKDDEFFEATF